MAIDLRSDVEAAISDEEETLGRVVELVRRRAPIQTWPPEDRIALGLAFLAEGLAPTERLKVTVLGRHLFGPRGWEVGRQFGPLPDEPTERQLRRADRIRADLPTLVPLRALAPQ